MVIVTDPVADMLNRLTTGAKAEKTSVEVPHSKLREAIASVLKNEGFIKDFEKKGKKIGKTLDIQIAYVKDNSKIQGVERISRPSRRMYYGLADIKSVKYGKGRLILSTSKGIMTGDEAKKNKLGGEPLFKIW